MRILLTTALLLVTIILFGPYVAKSDQLPTDLYKPMDPRQAAHLTAYTRSGDPASYKMAYVAQTTIAVEYVIRNDPMFANNPVAAAQYRDQALVSVIVV